MRILITGITGRIGANLALQLVAARHTVRGLVWSRDDRSSKLAGLGIELIEGSLTDRATVERACIAVEGIFHLGGAFQGGGPFSNDEYFEINVRGTHHVLEVARGLSNLTTLIIASTDAIYEKYVPGGIAAPIVETMPARPVGAYALTKALAEELALGYARTYHLPVIALRFALVVGAGEFATFPQFSLAHMRVQRQSLRIPPGAPEDALVAIHDLAGRPWRKHIIDVRDVIGACIAGLDAPQAHGHAIQLGAPEAFTWDEVVPDLAQRLGRPWMTAVDTGIPTDYAFDLSRCRTMLGYQPRLDTARMVADAVSFLRGGEIGVLPTL